jgi:hypothetical protein
MPSYVASVASGGVAFGGASHTFELLCAKIEAQELVSHGRNKVVKSSRK